MLLYFCLTISLAAASSYNYQLRTDEYNYFDFVRQWGPNLCYEASHACLPIPPSVNYWTIHGLWPSYDAKHYPQYCKSCHFNGTLLDPIREELEAQWMTDYSGGDEKFWSHEYCKHGTCCLDVLPTELEFFSKALQLHQLYKIDDVLQKKGINPSSEMAYSLHDVYNALNGAFMRPTFWCRFVKDSGVSKQLLYQVSICIDKTFTLVGCPAQEHESCIYDKEVYFIPNA